jgi:hypothetical protein
MRAELRQPLNAGFGHAIALRVPVAVAGDAECRVGLVRHENPEDADWSVPATAGASTLEVRARVEHPGAFLCLRFDAATGPPRSRSGRSTPPANDGPPDAPRKIPFHMKQRHPKGNAR